MDLFMSTALAQASEGAAQAAGKQPSMFETMLPMLFIFVVMYFIMEYAWTPSPDQESLHK